MDIHDMGQGMHQPDHLFGCCYWLTGRPAAGKSTLAHRACTALRALGASVFVLDGDHLRQGLNADLGYSPADRAENVRRIGEVAKLLADEGSIAIVSAVSPYAADRSKVRARFPSHRFAEVFVDADVDTCIARDPKGLYRQAQEGKLSALTGFNAPYEPPTQPDITISTAQVTVEEGVNLLLDHYKRLRLSLA